MGGKKKESKWIAEEKKQKQEDRLHKREMRKQNNRMKYGDDEWNSEFKKFGEQLAIHNLYIKDVAGDGNCLFRAISDQIDGTPERYDKYRQECVNFIELNRFDFEPFIEDDVPFDVYCAKMRKNATWGGNIEIQALSRLLGVNICIHQVDNPRWEVNNFPKNARQIHLSYHSGEHYASVRPLGSYAGVPVGIEIKPISAVANQPKKDPTRDEKLVMDSTGCDVWTVRHTMQEMDNDVEGVIEYLIAVKNTTKMQEEEYKREMKRVSAPPVSVSVPVKVVTSRDDEVSKIKKEIASLREQEDILMGAIVSSDPSVAEDLQVTLDVISLNISKLQDKLKNEEKTQVVDQDILYAQQLMWEEEEREKQRIQSQQKILEMQQREQEQIQQYHRQVAAAAVDVDEKYGHKDQNDWKKKQKEEKEEKIKKLENKGKEKHLSNRERKKQKEAEARNNKLEKKKEKAKEEAEVTAAAVQLTGLDLGAMSI